MKVVVITSCTGEKKFSPNNQLTQADFGRLCDSGLSTRESELAQYALPAEEIYTGMQHVRLMEGVRKFRESGTGNLDVHVLSAGYGLIPGNRVIVPYECTFQGMKHREITEWANHLGVPCKAHRLLASIEADLVLVLLGDSYLRALGLDNATEFASPTVFLTSTKSHKLVHGKGRWRTVELANSDAKRFSCGLVGLKGELAKRILLHLSDDADSFLQQMLDETVDVLSLLRSSNCDVPSVKRSACTANPFVDKIIQIPASWWEKPHRAKLRYFIPDWDDQVDPDYDFETDIHSGGSGDWSNQVYAHQMYPEPNYDGILISKVVAEQSKKKKKRINAMGVHRYLRVPREFPIMGDCGAFGYIDDEVPPYTTEEILDYYTRLDFDYGVSIDHLIVSGTEAQKQFRYDLTIGNAEEFIKEHRKQGLPWVPIGAVQGWDPKSYAEAVRQYVAMGYKYMALGGLVRSSTPEILAILEAVKPVIPDDVKLHLFGIARPAALQEFMRLGVCSIDSASYLRKAWLGSDLNFLMPNGWYSAIRIPQSTGSFRAKRLIESGECTLELLQQLERECLQELRQYASTAGPVPESLVDLLVRYDVLIAGQRKRTKERITRTLEDRPWERCGCAICSRWGVESVIFRGNNRNRRRGFHNTHVFYSLLQSIVTGERVNFLDEDGASGEQLSLSLAGGMR